MGQGYRGSPVVRRYRVLALSTYSIEKPLGGGQVVVSGIYKCLSNFFDVTLLSLVSHNQERKALTVKTGLQNIIIPMSWEETKALFDLEKRYGIGLSDYIHIGSIALSPEYLKEFEQLSAWADVIVFEHPYLVNILDHRKTDREIIYHAIDIEFLQKRDLYRDHTELLENIRAIEAKACRTAHAVFTTCRAEKMQLQELYPEEIGEKPLVIVPNGIDVHGIPFISRTDHEEAKKNHSDLASRIICLFVGSWHPPNLEAMEFIVQRLAPRNSSIHYFIIGSVRDYFFSKYGSEMVLPSNVHAFGAVGEDEKWELYKLADFAINPMFSGAGTNVKMIEYMAAGLPVLSTCFGARGIDDARLIYFEDAEGFFVATNTLVMDERLKKDMIEHNVHTVRQSYDAAVIATEMRDILYRDILGDYGVHLIDRVSDECSWLRIPDGTGVVKTLAQEIRVLIQE
jgi:glycosyltransferase involved in cell wall biosynthesis